MHGNFFAGAASYQIYVAGLIITPIKTKQIFYSVDNISPITKWAIVYFCINEILLVKCGLILYITNLIHVWPLNIQVLDTQGVCLYKGFSGGHFFAH